jgi:tellurite resistance protein
MDHTSTLHNLIQLSYSELTQDERSKVLDTITSSEELCETFSQIEQIKTALDTEIYSPNPTSIKIILEESQRSELEMH